MAFVEPFAAAFGIALLSEIADKTQLVILGLALRYHAPWKVFYGALGAHALMDGIAIALGAWFGFFLPANIIKIFIAALFIALGLWEFYKIYARKTKHEKKEVLSKAPLAASFLVVMASELGDKTQIASGLLSAKYLEPAAIFIGAVLALGLVIGLNVLIGKKIAEKIPRKTLKTAVAALFMLFGLLTLIL